MSRVLVCQFLLIFSSAVIGQIPSLYFPQKGTTLFSNNLVFDWQKNSLHASLDVELDTDSLFSNPIVYLLNNVVKNWQSQEVNQTLFVRNSPFNAPEFVSDFLNGKPAIRFGKSASAPSMTYLDFPPLLVAGGNFTFISLWKFNFPSSLPVQYILANVQEGIYAGGAVNFAGLRNMGVFKDPKHFGMANMQTILTSGIGSIRPLVIRRNKIGVPLSSNSLVVDDFTISRLGGRTDLTNLFLCANLPELILFSTTLSDSANEVVESYFLGKYGTVVRLPFDTLACAESISIQLARAGEFSSFLWSTGATTSNITIQQPGIYWVTAVNFLG